MLDVGGHFVTMEGVEFLPLAAFCSEDDVVVVDTAYCLLPDFVQGSGAALPFAEDSFDIVVTCDTLEHVPSTERAAFVSEMLRVSSRYALIASPFYGEEREWAERILYQFIVGRGGTHEPLRQHIEEGLPDKRALEQQLVSSGVDYCEFPGGNLYDWLVMMLTRHHLLDYPEAHALLRAIDRRYNVNFHGRDRFPPPYRSFFVVSQAQSDPLIDEVRTQFAPDDELDGAKGELHPYELLAMLLLEENRSMTRELEDLVKKHEQELQSILGMLTGAWSPEPVA